MAKKTSKPKRLKFHFTPLRDLSTGFNIDVFTFHGKAYPTPFSMPSTIMIEGQTFEVRYHTQIYASPHKKSRLRGIVLYNFRTIIIDPLQSIHDMRETLYHEMGHVYLRNWQKKGGSLTALTPNQVEEFCDLFAEGYYDASGGKLQR